MTQSIYLDRRQKKEVSNTTEHITNNDRLYVTEAIVSVGDKVPGVTHVRRININVVSVAQGQPDRTTMAARNKLRLRSLKKFESHGKILMSEGRKPIHNLKTKERGRRGCSANTATCHPIRPAKRGSIKGQWLRCSEKRWQGTKRCQRNFRRYRYAAETSKHLSTIEERDKTGLGNAHSPE